MVDLHTHTLFSDGELIPAELARRAVVLGYRAIAMTDHVDFSNIDHIVPRLVETSAELSEGWGIKVLPGVELTHLPPSMIAKGAERARALGAVIVVCHGETLVEPVAEGTNRAAIEAKVDILSHPGLITEEDAARAAELGVSLEVTTRKGHSLTNGHVVMMARKVGASLVVNNDAHAPSDLTTADFARNVALGAGMTEDEYQNAVVKSEQLAGLRT